MFANFGGGEARTRTPVSAHGGLFGGDSMYEVLVEVARLRRRQFHAFETLSASTATRARYSPTWRG